MVVTTSRLCTDFSLSNADVLRVVDLATAGNDEIVRFIRIARIANKYHFTSTEIWALRILVASFTTTSLSRHSIDTLVSVTEIAVLCSSSDLLSVAISNWKAHIGEGRHISLTISVAERLHLDRLRGAAYYVMMLKGHHVWDADPQLTRSQKICLLSGYYTISKKCESLFTTFPLLNHQQSCLHLHCVSSWFLFWHAVSKQNGIGDEIFSHCDHFDHRR